MTDQKIKIVAKKKTPFSCYSAKDMAMHFIGEYGHIDGDHHKAWVLDQVARALLGAPGKFTMTEHGDECDYSVTMGESEEYRYWVKAMCGDEDENGDAEFDYDEGIAP